MLITKEWLKNKSACKDGFEFVVKHNMIGLEHNVFIKKLMDVKKNDWANWVVARLMDKTQCVEYAVFAAEQVISIYEEKYPEDKRPRNAIQAAKNYLKNNNDADVAAAADAAYAASAYAAAADAASAYAAAASAAASAAAATATDASAAYASSSAAAANASAAAAAAAATDAATDAAYYAADAADAAYYAANAYADADAASASAIYTKIINYGLELLNKAKGGTI